MLNETSVNPIDNAEMVWIPEGEFLMGSTFDDDKPQHKVFLNGYWMYKNEVTVAQYAIFCTETERQMPEAPEWGWIDSHPIVYVTWQDAVEYGKWAGASLPTEAQWEKAARGTDGQEYPWGNQWDALKCNESSRGPKKTQPVGSYPAGVSPYGCLDMSGNVWEWCADWYAEDYYQNASTQNPIGPSDGSYRVLRGGGWYSYYLNNYGRCAARYFTIPYYCSFIFGFRLVR